MNYAYSQENKTVNTEKNQEPMFKGNWIQGGLLIGKTAAGNTVKLNNKTIYVNEKGIFTFGLGRDEEKQQTLTVTDAGGKQHIFTYGVEKRKYDVQKINGVESKYVSPPKKVLDRISKDAAQVTNARKTFTHQEYFTQTFIWPAKGRISGVYGSQRVFNGVPKRPHYGLDIAAAVGTKVYAPAEGDVTLAVNDMYYSGGTLILDHGQGVSSTFIHLSKILVKDKQHVKQGEPIAEIGATGRATGPHLDWRINWFDVRLDPNLLLLNTEHPKPE